MERKPEKRITLRSLDKFQLFATGILSLVSLWVISIFVRLDFVVKSSSIYSYEGVEKAFRLLLSIYKTHRILWFVLIVATAIFAYTTFIRKRIGSQIVTADNFISTGSYGVHLIFLLMIGPLMRLVGQVKGTFSNINDLDLDDLSVLFEMGNDLSSISTGRKRNSQYILILGAVLSLATCYLLYKRIYKGRRSHSLQSEVENLTQTVVTGSQKAKKSFKNQLEEFKESSKEREKEREKAKEDLKAFRKEEPNLEDEPIGPENLEENLEEIPLVSKKAEEELSEERVGPEELEESLADEEIGPEELEETIVFQGPVESVPKKKVETSPRKKEEEPTKENKSKKPINKKLFGAILVVGLLFFEAVLLVPRILDYMKPDAIVSTNQLDIEIEIEGFDGTGTATAQIIGEPIFEEVKKGMNEEAIRDYLLDQEITITPNENLKNGEVITAVLTFEETDRFRLELDREEIIREIEVSGLQELINSYKDLEDTIIEKIDRDFKNRIEDDFSGSTRNLEIQRISSFEKKIDEEDIEKNIFDSSEYTFANIYKIRYDQYYNRGDTKIIYLLFKADHFEESNGAYRYDILRAGQEKTEEEILNTIRFDGFEEIPSLKGDEPMKEVEKKEPEVEEKEEKEEAKDTTPKNESEKLSRSQLEKIARDYEDTTRKVENIANLRSGPSVNTDLLKTFQAGTPVKVLYTEINDEIRVWCYVRIDSDGDFYEGWMSHRVIK